MEPSAEVVAAVTAHWEQQQAAMLAGDAESLSALLAEDAVLTHMSGFRQSRGEWLAAVAGSEMTYHAIDVVDLHVSGTETAPVLVVRTLTAATIWGSSGTWPLALKTRYRATADGVTAAASVASTW